MRMTNRWTGAAAAGFLLAAGVAQPAPARPADVGERAQDAREHAGADRRQRARAMAERAIVYLRERQDPATGAWSHNPDGPNLPAITGLVLTGMLMDPRVDQDDPHAARAIDYILSFRQPDGGIYDNILPSYNTAVCLSALALVRTPDAAEAVRGGQGFLRSVQWRDDRVANPEDPDSGEPVGPDHPYYGGVGYGRHGRPDLSNLGFFLQAMHDTGVSADDPAVQRALTFLKRTQMLGEVNDMPYAEGSSQGGFIYATVPNRASVDGRTGQSFAGEIEEELPDGRRVSRLRAYGSMTYTGFKSLVYADLDRDDPRVIAAMDWIGRHYTLEENPGLGPEGLYYYYLSFARAFDAWGEQTIEVAEGDGSEARRVARAWAADLVDQLESLQNPDGSFRAMHDRWMEENPELITAYALIALQIARR